MCLAFWTCYTTLLSLGWCCAASKCHKIKIKKANLTDHVLHIGNMHATNCRNTVYASACSSLHLSLRKHCSVHESEETCVHNTDGKWSFTKFQSKVNWKPRQYRKTKTKLIRSVLIPMTATAWKLTAHNRRRTDTKNISSEHSNDLQFSGQFCHKQIRQWKKIIAKHTIYFEVKLRVIIRSTLEKITHLPSTEGRRLLAFATACHSRFKQVPAYRHKWTASERKQIKRSTEGSTTDSRYTPAGYTLAVKEILLSEKFLPVLDIRITNCVRAFRSTEHRQYRDIKVKLKTSHKYSEEKHYKLNFL